MRRALLAMMPILLVGSPLTANDKPDITSAQAQEAVETYLKAFRAEDINTVMKVSGVPFVMNDRGKVETGEALRQEFTRLFHRADMSKLQYKVKAVGTLDQVKSKLVEKKHEVKLKAILKEGDRVVLADADFGKRVETMSFAVTIRDGKALVVGMFD
jgi:hypothetical protein